MPPNTAPSYPGPGKRGAGAGASRGWSPAIKLLHWLVAALVLAQFLLGWLAANWHLSATKLNLFVWHKSIGLLVLALVIVRVACRLAVTAPPPPPGSPGWERAAARVTHVLLYALLLGMPLSGWVINSAAGFPFKMFWLLPLPAIVDADKHTATVAGLAHFSLGLALAVLLVVHVGAALRHHFIQRDPVLIRMMPARMSRK